MRVEARQPPRLFRVGFDASVELADCGAIALDADEQVTFTTPGGGEYDVVRKSWGFYATPSTNGRLARFGLRAVLVRSRIGQAFVLLVEQAEQEAFQEYVDDEGLRVLAWLDSDADLDALDPASCCPMCGGGLVLAHSYEKPPAGETPFPVEEGEYRREAWRCERCDHIVGRHDFDLDALYEGAYVDATYGDGMRATFERIVALAPERSDNAGRVERVVAFAAAHLPRGAAPTLLDIGAGLGVFPYAMSKAGWEVTALDPDPRAVAHLAGIGVAAVEGDFLAVRPETLGCFDAVTFNKVLEHVDDPARMLERSLPLVSTGGFVYVEVPDVAASGDGYDREEFYVEHLHVFSPASLALLAARSGFEVVALERVREPSTKFTLRAFLAPREARAGAPFGEGGGA